MPSRKHADDWVLALRDQLRISVDSAYRVSERRGKTKLDVRFQNGTRQYATLDIAWVLANSRKIQESVEKIAVLVIRERNIKEAYEALLYFFNTSIRYAPYRTDFFKAIKYFYVKFFTMLN